MDIFEITQVLALSLRETYHKKSFSLQLLREIGRFLEKDQLQAEFR